MALAGLLVLAGCSSTVAPGGADAGTPTAGTSTDDGATAADTTSGTGSGTVNFYVSDEVNAIDDFDHLNVTIEKVSFRRVGGDGEDDSSASGSTATPEAGTGTPTPTPAQTAESGTASETATPTPTPTRAAGSDAGTPTPTPAPTGTPTDGTETPSPTPTPTVGDEPDDDDGSDGEWIVREVDATTVDLTELRGENARMLSRFDLPEGEYTQVRIHISGVEGTLKNGETVNVKLPSEKLKLKKRFAVGDGEEVDFVYDATVFEAGQSGKYILKPVASQSGTDVPIQEVTRSDGEGSLGARFVGSVDPGDAVTVKVTSDGQPVSGATVAVDDRTYETGSDGTVMFDVPVGLEELEVTVEHGESKTELKRTFGGAAGGSDEGKDGENRGGSGNGDADGEPSGSGGANAGPRTTTDA